jgi:CDP-glycerol glycerophosphotransferase (TagB/SpsB family)
MHLARGLRQRARTAVRSRGDRLLRRVGRVLVTLSPLIPKKKSLVLFGNRAGDYYMDNSQHLFEWVLVNRKDIEAVWVTRSDEVLRLLKKSGKAVVNSRSLRGIWLLSRAAAALITCGLDDIAFDQAAIPPSLRVIFLSHGKSVKATAQASRDLEALASWKRCLHKFHSVVRCAIATSPFTAKLTEDARGVHTEVTGYPRNDVLLSPTEAVKARWREFLSQSRFEKVVLYGPTWRRWEPTQFFPFGDFDRASLLDFLQSRRILLLLRPHMEELRRYRAVRALVDDLTTSVSVRRASTDVFPDVCTLLPFVDVLVSDYSSLYHDFLLLDRPLMFVPYDYDVFSRRPGFMYDYLAHLPGPAINNFREFCSHLDSLCRGEDPFRDKRRALRDRIHTYQDSKSCERVAGLLDRVLQEGRL